MSFCRKDSLFPPQVPLDFSVLQLLALPSKCGWTEWCLSSELRTHPQELLISGQEEKALGVPLDPGECGKDLSNPTAWNRGCRAQTRSHMSSLAHCSKGLWLLLQP